MLTFAPANQPLQPATKQEIFQQHRRGDSAEALAERFCRSSTRIYRIINEIRAVRILDLPLDSMGDEQFAGLRTRKAERAILQPPPTASTSCRAICRRRSRACPAARPPYLANLYEVPLLTREQEAHLFRKMNYLKYKARRLRDKLDVNRPKSSLMDQIEGLYEESVAIKNQIILPTFGWWSRLPNGMSARRRTFSSLSATGTCR